MQPNLSTFIHADLDSALQHQPRTRLGSLWHYITAELGHPQSLE
jgi:hypothetical protein